MDGMGLVTTGFAPLSATSAVYLGGKIYGLISAIQGIPI